jgi:glucose-1-phosphate adenylyltransferase
MDIIRPDSEISPEEWGIRPNTEADGRPMDRAPGRFLSGCSVRSSMISAGCVIEGTVENSVLSPGVVVEKGAVVRDSVIFEDSIIESGAVVDLAICDKRVRIGSNAVVGHGDNKDVPNREFPSHLYTGITLVGKGAVLPPNITVGRNCIIHPDYRPDAENPPQILADGEIL